MRELCCKGPRAVSGLTFSNQLINCGAQDVLPAPDSADGEALRRC